MPVQLSDVLTSASASVWEQKILDWATSLGLSATSWQSGGVARTIIATIANAMALADSVTATIAAGGFLDTAADVTDAGGPGWLDMCAYYVYGVTRESATQGTSTIAIANSGAAIGPLLAGSFHLRAASGHTYRNATTITLSAASTTVVDIVCDQFGVQDNVGATMTLVTTFPGVSISGTLISTATGRLVESNAALVARCRDKLGALAPKLGNASSYRYFATTTTEPGYPLDSSTSLLVPITRVRVIAEKQTGYVDVHLANASGPPDASAVSAMQTYLDAVATPDSATMNCYAAVNQALPFSVTVWCPATYSTQVVTDVTTAIGEYIAALDIGGEVLETGGYGVSYNGLEDYIARKVTYIRTQTTLINGLPTSYLFSTLSPGNKVATVASVSVTRAGA